MKRLSPRTGMLLGGTILLGFALVLMRGHMTLLRDMRESSLPLASLLPPLERRLQLLQKQVELAELQAELRTGSDAERLSLYVLPDTDALQRLLSLFDVTRILLTQGGDLRAMSAIEISDPVRNDALTIRTLSFEATLSDRGLGQLLGMIDLSGLLTTGDALTPAQIDRLFALTEAENYAGIVNIEKFLGTDLLAYAREPSAHEEQVLRALSSERFLQEFKRLLQDSRLKNARELLGDTWGTVLQKQQLWPLQFMEVEELKSEAAGEGWRKVEMTFGVYGRVDE